MCSIDTEGIIGVLAWSACDHEGSRLVAVETKETTLVANVKQYGMMRPRQEEEYQELRKVITYMNERHREAPGNDGTKAKADERSS